MHDAFRPPTHRIKRALGTRSHSDAHLHFRLARISRNFQYELFFLNVECEIAIIYLSVFSHFLAMLGRRERDSLSGRMVSREIFGLRSLVKILVGFRLDPPIWAHLFGCLSGLVHQRTYRYVML